MQSTRGNGRSVNRNGNQCNNINQSINSKYQQLPLSFCLLQQNVLLVVITESCAESEACASAVLVLSTVNRTKPLIHLQLHPHLLLCQKPCLHTKPCSHLCHAHQQRWTQNPWRNFLYTGSFCGKRLYPLVIWTSLS